MEIQSEEEEEVPVRKVPKVASGKKGTQRNIEIQASEVVAAPKQPKVVKKKAAAPKKPNRNLPNPDLEEEASDSDSSLKYFKSPKKKSKRNDEVPLNSFFKSTNNDVEEVTHNSQIDLELLEMKMNRSE